MQKIGVIVLFLGFLLVSCNSEPSLQKYYVENQEDTNFMVLDIPSSIVELDVAKLTDKEKKVFKTFKKLNVLVFKLDSTNTAMYKTEKKEVKSILLNKEYKQLMSFNNKGSKAMVKYLGTEDEIDEVILFGSDDKMGFGIVRVLGDKMKPEDIATFVNAMRTAKIDDAKFKEVANFFKN